MPEYNSMADLQNNVFSKYPSDIQMKIKIGGRSIYIPFVGASYDVTKEMQAEHYSGSALPANLTEGNVDYKGTMETGWLVEGLPPDWEEQGYTMTDASRWEYLLYAWLIRPSNEGRSVPFTIEFHEREFTGVTLATGAEQVVGGEIWAQFMGCKINGHSFSSSQGSLARRTYPWMAKRVKWGSHPEI